MTVNERDEDESALALRCAQRFFLDDRSKVEIAEELGVSRFKVARLLALARERGLVTITINHPEPDPDDIGLLRASFGLVDLVVVPDRPDLRGIGRAGAEMAARYLEPGGLLGVGWGRAVDGVVAAFSEVVTPLGVDVVQLAGGILGSNPALDPAGVAVRAAAALGGRLTALPAPAFLTSEAIRLALMSEPSIATATAAFERLTVVVVGIGALGAETDSSLVASDALPPEGRAELTRLGATADVVCHFFDLAGQAVTAWEGRTVAATVAQLAGADVRIGVAAGRTKATAVLSALRSGVINALVTDGECAQAVARAVRMRS